MRKRLSVQGPCRPPTARAFSAAPSRALEENKRVCERFPKERESSEVWRCQRSGLSCASPSGDVGTPALSCTKQDPHSSSCTARREARATLPYHSVASSVNG